MHVTSKTSRCSLRSDQVGANVANFSVILALEVEDAIALVCLALDRELIY